MLYPRKLSSVTVSTATRINRANPLATHLQFWSHVESVGHVLDLASGTRGDIVAGNHTDGVTDEGSFLSSGASLGRINFDGNEHGIGQGPWTLTAKWRSLQNNSGTTRRPVISLPNNDEFGLFVPLQENLDYLGAWSTVDSRTHFPSATVATGELHTFSVTIEGNNGEFKGYKNGEPHAIGFAKPSPYPNGTSGISLFYSSAASGLGELFFAAAWSRELDSGEQHEFYHNPYQVLTNGRTVMWMPLTTTVPPVSTHLHLASHVI